MALVDVVKANHEEEKRVSPDVTAHVNLLTTGFKDKEMPNNQSVQDYELLLHKRPGATYSFKELVTIEENLMTKNAFEFTKKLEYQKMTKDANQPYTEERYKDDPEQLFFIQCAQDTNVPLMFLSKIHNHTLSLANYTLSSGHFKALNRAAPCLEALINRIRFQNNGIIDKDMGVLISIFARYNDFKSIIYRKNQFGTECLKSMKSLLSKVYPQHLQELRISDCKVHGPVASQLISDIAEKCFLKQLELSRIPMSANSLEIIAKYASQSKFLEEIDISQNDMTARSMQYFLNMVRKNKKLQFLSIAKNNLIEKVKGHNMEQAKQSETIAITTVNNLLKEGRKLIHLNLSQTNLSEHAILSMLPWIRKARSLMGIHLSGNPGITRNVKEKAKTVLKLKQRPEL